MKLRTASETLSFIKDYEQKLIDVYNDLEKKCSANHGLFISLADEGKKYIREIDRAYYSVISDAIEGCFAFDIESEEYSFSGEKTRNMNWQETLLLIIKMEEQLIALYNDAANQSSSLLADVPRAFKIIVKKRSRRIPKLLSFIDELT